ncbi:MAG: DsbA family protein [Acidobacteriia bacterium]|nr:DsbA family protein [Terriglobia bacterium]
MKISWKKDLIAIGLSLAWLLAPASLLASNSPSETELKLRVEHYLTRYFQLAPQESLTVDQIWSVDNPPMWGLSVTRKQAGKTSTEVYMLSKDLKQLSLGRVLDFSRDLDAENFEKINLGDAPSRGPNSALVTLITYCDLQCPDCKAMSTNLRKVLPAYIDSVRFVFKNFPLMSKHAWAEAAAVASRCAFVQRADAFWNFYDFFYTYQDSVTKANIREKALEVGKEAGLDATRLATCYDSKATLPDIQKDLFEANKLGVRGTPTLLVNGRFVFNEEMTEQDYHKLIDEALATHSR